ncbi:MAG: PepSY domain-containing protein [Hellea sp.]|nr:PepSY domain-containing protein [Hellea sp.]
MMKKIRHISLLAAASLMALGSATNAFAKPPAHDKDRKKVGDFTISSPLFAPNYVPAERNTLPQWAQQRISFSQAKSAALAKYPGAKYIDMYLDGNVYRVKLLLKNNKIKEVKVDAITGRVR